MLELFKIMPCHYFGVKYKCRLFILFSMCSIFLMPNGCARTGLDGSTAKTTTTTLMSELMKKEDAVDIAIKYLMTAGMKYDPESVYARYDDETKEWKVHVVLLPKRQGGGRTVVIDAIKRQFVRVAGSE